MQIDIINAPTAKAINSNRAITHSVILSRCHMDWNWRERS